MEIVGQLGGLRPQVLGEITLTPKRCQDDVISPRPKVLKHKFGRPKVWGNKDSKGYQANLAFYGEGQVVNLWFCPPGENYYMDT